MRHSRAFVPLIPPTSFSHKGRRGSLGVLKPKMRGNAGTSQKSYAASHQERRGLLGVLKPKTGNAGVFQKSYAALTGCNPPWLWISAPMPGIARMYSTSNAAGIEMNVTIAAGSARSAAAMI